MSFSDEFKSTIFSITRENFEAAALQAFRFQANANSTYKSYLNHLRIDPGTITTIDQIPFLPIDFFKTHQVMCHDRPIEVVFKSSGTTGQIRSQHHVSDLQFYYLVSERIFEYFYGPLENYTFYALLPSYAERDDSSLIYMINYFITKSKNPKSGFYLNDQKRMIEALKSDQIGNKIVWGVTFALLDLAETTELDLSSTTLIETGGMKGRRIELIREEVHAILKKKFKVSAVGSEYGMTELLSQAYSIRDGIFKSPPWMKIMLRSTTDPFDKGAHMLRGGVNVIDLANIDSCCFIETKDLGKIEGDTSFSILGRLDNSEIRGCNLLL